LKIVTPKDGTFALSDMIAQAIKQTPNWIAIASPWADMGLAEYFRKSERALTVLFLTRTPEDNNRVYERTLETIHALQKILNEKGGHLEVRYSSKLHDKFIVNGVVALKGSLNYTTCGRFHNFESLEVIDEPNVIRELENWFKFMWKHPTTKASLNSYYSRNKKNFNFIKS
jgi:phosphatidylserine/phosphatidylglycerophosphate/cardiolipin synthase-like enzyme